MSRTGENLFVILALGVETTAWACYAISLQLNYFPWFKEQFFIETEIWPTKGYEGDLLGSNIDKLSVWRVMKMSCI